jgi:hypothetical protein
MCRVPRDRHVPGATERRSKDRTTFLSTPQQPTLASHKPFFRSITLVCVRMECLAPYIPPALLSLVERAQEQVQNQTHTLSIAVLSLSAVLLGYLFVAGSRESPVSFTVPNPPEINPHWEGSKWEDLPQGSEERNVIEGQIRGVSAASWLDIRASSGVNLT